MVRFGWSERLGGAIVLLLVLARLHLLVVRLYDPDEFEHLHAAFCIAKGLVPYRDFFEHHGPVPYYLTAPLVRWFGAEPVQLTLQRLVAFGFVLALLPAVWLLAARLYGRRAGTWALVWLLSFNWFIHKSVEWRPDVLATVLLAWAALVLVRWGHAGLRGGFLAGALAGGALLTTPKPVFLAGGMAVGAILMLKARGAAAIKPVTGGVMGALLPWILCAAWFWHLGAADDWFRCQVVYPLTWKMREPFTDFFTGAPWWSPVHLGLGVFGLVRGLCGLFAAERRAAGEPILTLGCTCHWLSLPLLPAAFLQYYLLALPLLAVLAAGAIETSCVKGWTLGRRHWLRRAANPLVFALLAFAAGIALRWHELRWVGSALYGSLQQATLGPLLSLPKPALYTEIDLLSAALLGVGILTWIFGRRLGVALLWLAICLPGIGRDIVPHFYWSNQGQLADLRTVLRAAGPDEPVLDGFSGLGCLRPHAFYWWWINRHTVALLTAEGKLSQLEAVIAARKPGLIIFDDELYRLADLLLPAIEAGYRPLPQRVQTGGPSTVLFRRLQ